MKRFLILVLLSLLAFGSFGAVGAPLDQTCTEKCQETHRKDIGVCNTFYPPKSQAVKHRECLDKAKTTFDGCLATCRANKY